MDLIPCTVLDHFLASFLCYAVFISRNEDKDVCPRKNAALFLNGSFSNHILFFLPAVFLPTNLDCCYQHTLVGSTVIQLLVFETYGLVSSGLLYLGQPDLIHKAAANNQALSDVHELRENKLLFGGIALSRFRA